MRCATCAKLITAPSKRSCDAIELATTTPAISRTQFFAKLLEGNSLKGVERTRGRFRSYLLGAVKHFLSDQVVRSLAEKRGSGQSPQSLHAFSSHDRSERQEHARSMSLIRTDFPRMHSSIANGRWPSLRRQ